MSKTYRESDAERVLMDWARNQRQVYGGNGYPTHSPEQSLAGGGGKDTGERDYTLQESLCNREMLLIKRDDDVMHTVAVKEFGEKDWWIAKCRNDGGWAEKVTGIWHVVDEPRKSHFRKHCKIDYGIAESTYYNKLKRLKKRIWLAAC